MFSEARVEARVGPVGYCATESLRGGIAAVVGVREECGRECGKCVGGGGRGGRGCAGCCPPGGD